MRAPSHVAFGFFWGGLFATAAANRSIEFGMNELTVKCALVTFAGCLAPDLDCKEAPIARLLPFLGSPIRRRFPHRTLLHSFTGLFIASGLVAGIVYLLGFLGLWIGTPDTIPVVIQFFAWAYFSHLVLDTLTVRGVPYFFPLLKNPFGYPSFEGDRIRSSDKRWGFIITSLSLIVFSALIPVIQQGANTTLANVFGQFYQLKDVYTNVVNRELVLEFEGYFEYDKAPVSGRALILAATSNYFIIYCDGQIHYLGEESGDIQLLEGQIQQLDYPLDVRSDTYHNRKLSDILSDIKRHVLM